jgi:hypothetical protein
VGTQTEVASLRSAFVVLFVCLFAVVVLLVSLPLSHLCNPATSLPCTAHTPSTLTLREKPIAVSRKYVSDSAGTCLRGIHTVAATTVEEHSGSSWTSTWKYSTGERANEIRHTCYVCRLMQPLMNSKATSIVTKEREKSKKRGHTATASTR